MTDNNAWPRPVGQLWPFELLFRDHAWRSELYLEGPPMIGQRLIVDTPEGPIRAIVDLAEWAGDGASRLQAVEEIYYERGNRICFEHGRILLGCDCLLVLE